MRKSIVTLAVLSILTLVFMPIPPIVASSFQLSVKTTDNIIALNDTTNINIALKNGKSTQTGNVYVSVSIDSSGIQIIKADSTWGAFDIQRHIWLIGNMDPSQSVNLTLTMKGLKNGAYAIHIMVYEDSTIVSQKTIYIGVEEEPDIDISITKNQAISFILGQTPYIELSVINKGGYASDVKVNLQTDNDIKVVSKGNCSQGTMLRNVWNVGAMLKGQIAKCLIQIAADKEGIYNGIAKVISPLTDSNPNNNEVTLTFNVKRVAGTQLQLYAINPFFLPGDNLYFSTIVVVKGPSAEKNLTIVLNTGNNNIEKILTNKGTVSGNKWILGNIPPGIYFGIWKISSQSEKPIIIEANAMSDITHIKKATVMTPKNVSDIALILPDGKNNLDTAQSYPLPIVVINKGTTVAENIVVSFNINGGDYRIIDSSEGTVTNNSWKLDKLPPGKSASLYVNIINKKEGPVKVNVSVSAKTKTKDIYIDNNHATWTGYFRDKGAPSPPIVKKIRTIGQSIQVLIISPADKDLSSIWSEVNGREIYRFLAEPGKAYLKTIKLSRDGNFTINFYAQDTFGNNSPKTTITATIDTTPPYTIWNIPDKGIIKKNPFSVKGITEPGTSLLIRVKAGNLREAYYQPDISKEGKFSFNMYLFKGINEICIHATDKAGNHYNKCSIVSYPKVTVISFTVGKKIGYINGKKYLLEVPATIINGTTYIPVRFMAEAMGMELQWYGMEKKIILRLGDTAITLYLNKPYASVNNKIIYPFTQLPVINGRSLVPVRFIAETVGARVQWIPKNKTINIVYP